MLNKRNMANIGDNMSEADGKMENVEDGRAGAPIVGLDKS